MRLGGWGGDNILGVAFFGSAIFTVPNYCALYDATKASNPGFCSMFPGRSKCDPCIVAPGRPTFPVRLKTTSTLLIRLLAVLITTNHGHLLALDLTSLSFFAMLFPSET